MKNYIIYKKVIKNEKIKNENLIVCNNIKNVFNAYKILNNNKYKLFIKVSNKAYTKYQKTKIQKYKDNIINHDNVITKARNYLKLIAYLEILHNDFINNISYKDNIIIDYKIENSKISAKDTIIFSLGTALFCYSAIKGYCQLYKNKKCYAIKNELQYNFSILFKHRQYKQFKKHSAEILAENFINIKNKYNDIKYIRLNESADIQIKHMQKLNKIANIIKNHDIKLYTYTHNIEIKNEYITSNNFTINSSNKNIKLSNRFLSYDKKKINRILNIQKVKTNKTNIKFKKCIADCSICKLCTSKKDITILCNMH